VASKSTNRKGRSELERVAILHGALVLLTAALMRLPGGVPWILTAPANLLPVLILPSFLLVPLFLKRRSLLVSGLQIASVVVGCTLFGGRLFEELTGSEESFVRRENVGEADGTWPNQLRVFTYNTGVGLASAERVAEFLEEAKPDIVCLVEVTNRFADQLETLTAASYPHRVFYAGGIDGKGLLSKYPITSQELFAWEDGRPFLRATLDVLHESVELFVVHFSPTVGILDRGAAAGRDLDKLVKLVHLDSSTLIAGDFNTTMRSPSHALLNLAGFRDSFIEAGSGIGPTFPVFGRYFGLPIGCFMRIDYVWHGSSFWAEQAKVGPDLGSDHLPVIVDLRLLARHLSSD
jgi:endonuclease/exonuclease/phosphatase (EEP) superfamily protein YafD